MSPFRTVRIVVVPRPFGSVTVVSTRQRSVGGERHVLDDPRRCRHRLEEAGNARIDDHLREAHCTDVLAGARGDGAVGEHSGAHRLRPVEREGDDEHDGDCCCRRETESDAEAGARPPRAGNDRLSGRRELGDDAPDEPVGKRRVGPLLGGQLVHAARELDQVAQLVGRSEPDLLAVGEAVDRAIQSQLVVNHARLFLPLRPRVPRATR